MINIDNYRQALNNLQQEILEAEFNIEKNESRMIKVSHKEITDNSYSDLTEIFARVSGDRTGFSYTQDIMEDPLEIIQRAYNNSLDIDDLNKNILNKEGKLSIIHIESYSTEKEMAKYAASLEDVLLNSHKTIEKVIVEARVDKTLSHVLNSYGLYKSYEREIHYLSAHIMAKKDDKVYNANFAISSKDFSEINLEEISTQIVNQLESQFDPINFETGK